MLSIFKLNYVLKTVPFKRRPQIYTYSFLAGSDSSPTLYKRGKRRFIASQYSNIAVGIIY